MRQFLIVIKLARFTIVKGLSGVIVEERPLGVGVPMGE
jgi:hypothetical protein